MILSEPSFVWLNLNSQSMWTSEHLQLCFQEFGRDLCTTEQVKKMGGKIVSHPLVS